MIFIVFVQHFRPVVVTTDTVIIEFVAVIHVKTVGIIMMMVLLFY